MQLGIFDRIVLLDTLPREGDIMTVRIIRDLRGALSFSEDDHAELQFQQQDGKVYWREEAEYQKEIEIGPKAKEIISDRLKALDKLKKLKVDHIDIFERFVAEAGDDSPASAPEEA